MLRTTLTIALTLILLASTAQAQSVYRWVDDNGETHYGDSVPTEFKDYGYVRLGPDGTVRERVEPALSPEEIIEQRKRRAAQASEEAEQRRRATEDRMLLATYRSAEELRLERDSRLAGIRNEQSALKASLDLYENRYEKLASRAARESREGKGISRGLQNEISDARSRLRQLRADLEDANQRELTTRQRFDQRIKRYRELTGGPPDD